MQISQTTRNARVRKPEEICLQCFNAQEQFTFPFFVYCEHKRSLALIRSADEHATFACAPEQLDGLLGRLGARDAQQQG